MLPKAWGEAHWVVAKGGHVLDEFFLGNYAGLFEPIHAFVNAHVDEAVLTHDGAEVVCLDDFLWDD